MNIIISWRRSSRNRKQKNVSTNKTNHLNDNDENINKKFIGHHKITKKRRPKKIKTKIIIIMILKKKKDIMKIIRKNNNEYRNLDENNIHSSLK